jgi:hypothetical protein
MCGDDLISIRGVQDIDVTRFDDEKVDIRVPGVKNELSILELAGLGEQSQGGEVGIVQQREGGLVVVI